MIWADPLHDGPVPGDVSDDELLRLRAAFLAGSPEDVDHVVADLSDWRAAVDDQAGYDELVLWFEHDLFDQLNVIQLLTHLGARALTKPVTMVSIDSFQGHPDFKGIGELAPADLVALFETRRPIALEQFALAARDGVLHHRPVVLRSRQRPRNCFAAALDHQPVQSQGKRTPGGHTRADNARAGCDARPRGSNSPLRDRSLARRGASGRPRADVAMEPAQRPVARMLTALRSTQVSK
jgi:hypothetical protein